MINGIKSSEIEAIDEDDLGVKDPSDVAGQLEVINRNEDDDDENQPSTSASIRPGTRKRKNDKINKSKKWTQRDSYDDVIDDENPPPLVNTHPELCNLSPIELFETILSDDILHHIVEQSTLYATRDLNCPIFDTSVEEMRKF